MPARPRTSLVDHGHTGSQNFDGVFLNHQRAAFRRVLVLLGVVAPGTFVAPGPFAQFSGLRFELLTVLAVHRRRGAQRTRG